MKVWIKAAAAAAVAVAGMYAAKRFFARRTALKEVDPWSAIVPGPLSDTALLQNAPYRMMHPLLWVGKENGCSCWSSTDMRPANPPDSLKSAGMMVNRGSSYRGVVLNCPVESCCDLEAVQWTVRIRTAFAAIGGAAASSEPSSSGLPPQLDMYGSEVSWLALNSSYDKAFGAAQEHEAERFVSCSDDQDVSITFYPATSLITVSTADFNSSIAKPAVASFVRPVIFISPGNAVSLLQVRTKSRRQ